MKRDIRLYLEDIWESVVAIEQYTQAITEAEFFENRQVQDAVLRRLEIIGEAAKHIDEDFRRMKPDIPWKKLAGMRDVLIHEYFGVNLKRVWRAIKSDLPDMKREIAEIREK